MLKEGLTSNFCQSPASELPFGGFAIAMLQLADFLLLLAAFLQVGGKDRGNFLGVGAGPGG